ncbi:VOC family protein [Phreatobacter sp.]|uniref:bleomycin resistance protein n=1 Tax=Phreatobacter sp. TaxID=1966341 RepID=UPI0022BEDCF6|nr:VOC family protein [Phreatobacter sp.]MCZ8315146.1 VOC family protein [Phreatobacter sp.]
MAAQLKGFSAVFTVRDVAASLAFYRDRLGFRLEFGMGEPPTYAIIERETVSLHLMPASQSPDGLGTSSIYVYVDDVDGLHAGLVAMACPISFGPEDLSYGMREIAVRDPDGNRITFGAPLPKAG